MKKTAVFLVLGIFFNLKLDAQELQGKITDLSGTPLIGAHISNASNNTHSHSDLTGFFLLKEFNQGDSLIVSYIGYKPRIINNANSDTFLTIMLEEQLIELSEILIRPDVDAINMLADIDLQTAPVNSSQDILRKVPGLFISQHAGGGKAEQIFLRGFDLDHGTDIDISVDGLPVNMVSHAHGQGYSDLHFIIPETIEKIEFGKGPYYGDHGNFSTAAYVDFTTRRSLDNNIVKVEFGDFNTQRLLTMLEFLKNDQQSAYIASEIISSDGPFDSPQNFRRFNIQGNYNIKTDDDEFTFIASYFTSNWNASGQIPIRAVEQGLIGRFGAIDDTEGGHTGRTNLSLQHTKFINGHSFIKNQLYYSRYDFELYSNFTFFLNDPINGDQIRQKESRDIYGFKSEYNHALSFHNVEAYFKLGAEMRSDIIKDNELSRTIGRFETAESYALGDVEESNVAAYADASFIIGQFNINPALRYDLLKFNYVDRLQGNYLSATAHDGIVSPKLNITYNPSPHFQLYFKSGFGFHSNDTRVVVSQSVQNTLPRAYGYDLGLLWKPIPTIMINTAYWTLHSEQEFVYVGDEGIVEPSDKSIRKGIDLSMRHQALQWLFWNVDLTYAHARSGTDDANQEYIPLAPPFTLTGGVDFKHPSGLFGGTKFRMLTQRPGNEDYSIALEAYQIVDFNVGYAWNNVVLAINVQNLLNSAWKETQFVTNSRLQDETVAVEEIHFIPGTPRNMKFSLSYNF